MKVNTLMLASLARNISNNNNNATTAKKISLL
jgi:hypothetical protein